MLVTLTLAALREFYALDRRVHNDYIPVEFTQRVEAKELGITCGFADRYVPLFGGIAYLDYRGKLHHLNIRQEPYVTYERLDSWVDDLPLVAISTGVVRDSGDVHSRMRPRYLQEHARVARQEWRHTKYAAGWCAICRAHLGNGLARQDRLAGAQFGHLSAC